jgi:hypothetical protein
MRRSFLLKSRSFYYASRRKHRCAASYLIQRKQRANALRIQGLDNAISHFDEVMLALSKISAGVYSI